MNKSDNKRLFKAIEDGDWSTVEAILDKNPNDVDVHGISNRLCRDKTPLMYAMQCENFEFARRFIDRGANVCARMPDGPKMSVSAQAAKFGHGLFEDGFAGVVEWAVSAELARGHGGVCGDRMLNVE